MVKQIEIINAVLTSPRVSVRSGHKVSKALVDSTPIFTPRGWRQHGDLKEGDMVFAVDGSPCRVVNIIRVDDPKIRVHFDDVRT